MNQPLLGIDLGGTKIEVAALSPDDGRFLLRERMATPTGYDALLRAIGDLVLRAESELGVRGLPLGVGIPGCLSPATAVVKGANTTVLNGRALDRDLARLLHRPVRVENDANAWPSARQSMAPGAARAWCLPLFSAPAWAPA